MWRGDPQSEWNTRAHVGRPCTCLECQAADVTALPIVRVPADEFVRVPHWLHGESLRRWYEARAAFFRGERP